MLLQLRIWYNIVIDEMHLLLYFLDDPEGRGKHMIILSREEIEAVVDPNEMMDTIEEAYRIFGENEFYMPERPVVEHENKTLMYMPCYTKEGIGTKILSIFPENAKLGLPSIDGVVLLNDQKTGAPAAVLDGQSVTAWRTGAVGGVGIRHLSRKDCHTVGIVGAGYRDFTLQSMPVRPGISERCMYSITAAGI